MITLQDNLPASNYADEMIDVCLKSGADEAEVHMSHSQGLALSSRMGKPENIEKIHDNGAQVRVFKDKRSASVSTTDLSKKSLIKAARQACEIASFTEQDDCNGLANPELLARNFRDLDLYYECPYDKDELIDLTLRCENAALAHPSIKNSQGASLSTQFGLHFYANSNGFSNHTSGSVYSLSCAPVAQKGNDMRTDYDYDCARNPKVLERCIEIGEKSAQRTAGRLDARMVPSQKAPVLFEARVASSLIRHLIGAISGSNLYNKTSFLLDCLDQQILNEDLSLVEYPFLKSGMRSCCFDSEGVATKQRSIVSKGVLTSYVLDSYSARRLGLETTGNADGTHNSTLSSNSYQTFDELLERMNTGLLATELSGFGADLATGNYSRGVGGYWVENGKIAYPVDKILIAGELRSMFKSIVGVGDDRLESGSIRTGSILIDAMTIAGD